MRWIRRWQKEVARLLAAAFVYALLLPPGAVPCVHHRAAAPKAASGHAIAGAHGTHGAAWPASTEADLSDGSPGGHRGELGCGCCIGGMCAGTCGGGCRLPAACCGAGTPIDLLLDASALTAAPSRVVADARADLSAPLVRPQAPRAPPAL